MKSDIFAWDEDGAVGDAQTQFLSQPRFCLKTQNLNNAPGTVDVPDLLASLDHANHHGSVPMPALGTGVVAEPSTGTIGAALASAAEAVSLQLGAAAEAASLQLS